jgi:hypothetical protein
MIWPVDEAWQREAMAKMWDLFPVSQPDPLHIRAIWGKGVPNPRPPRNITFNAAAYPWVADRKRAFEDAAIWLNKQGYNIYTCFNLIRPNFAGDERNGLAVRDSDILCRRYVLIDLDRPDNSKPATDDESDAVFATAHKLEMDLFYSNGDDPITVSSGNGAHVYLPVDLPNDECSKTLCREALKRFASKYDSSAAQVDTSVFNAARITKVPGTIARKGVEVPDPTGFHERYWRMVGVVA